MMAEKRGWEGVTGRQNGTVSNGTVKSNASFKGKTGGQDKLPEDRIINKALGACTESDIVYCNGKSLDSILTLFEKMAESENPYYRRKGIGAIVRRTNALKKEREESGWSIRGIPITMELTECLQALLRVSKSVHDDARGESISELRRIANAPILEAAKKKLLPAERSELEGYAERTTTGCAETPANNGIRS